MFDICPIFLCHVTLNLAETLVAKSQLSVPYGANVYKGSCFRYNRHFWMVSNCPL